MPFTALPLERCMRIVPQDQNSGAFFVAIFHKVSTLPANEKICTNLPEETDSSSAQLQEHIDEVKEDEDGLDIDLTSATAAVQIPEPTPHVDVLDSKIHEASLDTDESMIDKDKAKDKTEEATTDAKMATGKKKLQSKGDGKGWTLLSFTMMIVLWTG